MLRIGKTSLFRISQKFRMFHSREAGVALLEAVVALGIMGIVATIFLTGLGTAAKADLIVNERSDAEGLARSQMDNIKNSSYIDFSQVGHGDYSLITAPTLYTVSVATVPIDPATGQALASGQDNGVQKITVTVNHQSKQVMTLSGYKVYR